MSEKDALQMQQLFRDVERLHERLRTGQRLLKDAIQSQSIVQATKLIDHFALLNQEVIQKTEELMLMYQFTVLGINGHVLRNGRYMSFDEVKQELDTVPLDPQLLLALEKIKSVFGEIPHDIFHIEGDVEK